MILNEFTKIIKKRIDLWEHFHHELSLFHDLMNKMKKTLSGIILLINISLPVFAYDRELEESLILDRFDENEVKTVLDIDHLTEQIATTQDNIFGNSQVKTDKNEYRQTVIVNFDKNVMSKEEWIDFLENKNIGINYVSKYYDTMIISITNNQFLNIRSENGLVFFFNFELETHNNPVVNMAGNSSYIEDLANIITLHSANFKGDGQTVVVVDGFFNQEHEFIKENVIDGTCYGINVNLYSDWYPFFETISFCKENFLLRGYDDKMGRPTSPGSVTYDNISQNSFLFYEYKKYMSDHGTGVAGIVAGKQIEYNGKNISGVAPNSNLMLYNFDRGTYTEIGNPINGFGILIPIFDGLLEKIENGNKENISVVNMSIALRELYSNYCDDEEINLFELESPTIQKQINDLTNLGVIFVAASGNDNNNNAVDWPSCLKNVISVGAVDKEDNIVSYSNEAEILDVYGYTNLITADPNKGDNNYRSFSGTSAATPFVSGSIALIRSVFPDWDKDTIIEVINEYSHNKVSKVSGRGIEGEGFPIVNPHNVIVNNLKHMDIFEVQTVTDNGIIIVKINSQAQINDLSFNSDFIITSNDNDKTIEAEVSNLPNGIFNLEISYSFKLKEEETYIKNYEINNRYGELYIDQHSVTANINNNTELRNPILTFTVTATDTITIKNTDAFKTITTADNKQFAIEKHLTHGANTIEIIYYFNQVPDTELKLDYQVTYFDETIYLSQNNVVANLQNHTADSPVISFNLTATDTITIHNTEDFKSVKTTDNVNYTIEKELQEGSNALTLNYSYARVPDKNFTITYILQVTKEVVRVQNGFTDIATCQDLQNMQDNPGGQYELLNSIDCSGFDFKPIGSAEQPFKGTLQGNGHTIRNLKITGYDSSGLFAYTKQALITNLAIDSFNFEADLFAGALIAQSLSSTLNNISVNNVSVRGETSGTLLGKSSKCRLENIIFSGEPLIGFSLFDSRISSLYSLDKSDASGAFGRLASDTIDINALDMTTSVLNNGTWNESIWDTASEPMALIPQKPDEKIVYRVEIIQ